MAKRSNVRAHYAPTLVTRIAHPTTDELIALTVQAARDPLVKVVWPDDFDRAEAPRLVWELCRSLQYVADTDLQAVRSPRVLLDTGVGDCKSFAVLCAKVCKAAGWRVWLRFVSNEQGRPVEHVYAVAQSFGQTCIIDGTITTFDTNPPFYMALDIEV
jgi:transglutaminase-like putative cysteine protease